jgi:hypothetical protein
MPEGCPTSLFECSDAAIVGQVCKALAGIDGLDANYTRAAELYCQFLEYGSKLDEAIDALIKEYASH